MVNLLTWYDENKRDLPWRMTKDPYKVWISEIILQQTRVEFGTSYYKEFINTFPNVESLAQAEETEVLKLWQGLGYYSRARNLHFSAKKIFLELNNEFPSNFEDLIKLKGVGNYTAAAIASICFKKAVPALDGNAFRVYSRVFNIDKDISLQKNQSYFFQLGKEIISDNRPGDFNQAIMDLGSRICTPKKPKCNECPLNSKCMALQNGTVLKLPVKTKKIKTTKRKIQFLVIKNEENFLLQKNTTQNIWKNLYLFPLYEFSNQNNFTIQVQEELKYRPKKEFELKHQLTHQTLNIQFWVMNLDTDIFNLIQKKKKLNKVSISNMEDFPIPKPVEFFLHKHFNVFS